MKLICRQIFVINDSISLRPYLKEVQRLIYILYWLLDENKSGSSILRFASSAECLRPKSAASIHGLLDKRTFQHEQDLGRRLKDILEERRKGLRKAHPFKSIWISSHTKLGPRNFSLYVLTDSSWQPSSKFKDLVKSLIAETSDRKLDSPPIGIQFISFGNDQGTEPRLKDRQAEITLDM